MTRPNVSAVERLQTELNKASANIRLWRDKHSDLVEALRRQEAEPAQAQADHAALVDIYSLIQVRGMAGVVSFIFMVRSSVYQEGALL